MATQRHHIGAFLVFVVLICAIVAVAVNDWSKNDFYTLGLWNVCPSGFGCVSIDCSDTNYCVDSFKAVRAFSLLAFIFAFVTFVVTLAAFYGNRGKREFVTMSTLITGFCALIAWAIWVGKVDDNGPYGAGVAFEIITWILAWIAAAFTHTQT